MSKDTPEAKERGYTIRVTLELSGVYNVISDSEDEAIGDAEHECMAHPQFVEVISSVVESTENA